MAVYAVTPIVHGNADGSITHVPVNGEIKEGSPFDEAAIVALIAAGSAVEIGSKRKYSTAPAASADPGAADEATRKRDELLAKAASGTADTADDVAEEAEPTATATP